MLKKLLQFNWFTFLSMVALTVIGVIFIRSAGEARTAAALQDAWRLHAATALFGLILYFTLSFLDYRKILDLGSTPYFLVSVILLVAVLAFGEKVYGGKRWLLFFQPSEVAKLAVILMVAKVFGRKRPTNTFLDLLHGLGLLALPALLILAEPDLGTALVLVPAILVMLLCARVCLRVLIPVLAACLLAAVAILAASGVGTRDGVVAGADRHGDVDVLGGAAVGYLVIIFLRHPLARRCQHGQQRDSCSQAECPDGL